MSTRKIYRIKSISASKLICVGGALTRIEFKGGNYMSDNCGMFSTSDPNMQKAIEELPDFGNKNTHDIFISEVF